VGFSKLFNHSFSGITAVPAWRRTPPATSQATAPLPGEGIKTATQIFRTPMVKTPTRSEAV
jgi:hypothetical protein